VASEYRAAVLTPTLPAMMPALLMAWTDEMIACESGPSFSIAGGTPSTQGAQRAAL
jgi:hypothetical protein